MKRTIKLFFSAIGIIFFYSCDDIIEEDISNDSVLIVSPIEGTIIEGNNVQFLWQSLDGADDYRVQILSDNQTLIKDSLVSDNELNYNLNIGNYQWRVKGENFAYETEYTFPVNFSVEVSENLNNQNVSLLTPSDDLYTNDPVITLTWSAIDSANSYDVEIIRINNGQTTILQEPNITSASISLNSSLFDVDAEYVWKVKAVNDSSETLFSERTLFIDRVLPNQPSLNSPDNNSTSSTIVTFNWLNGDDTGNIQSAISNTLEISSDINFNTLLLSEEVQNNSYQYTFATTGTYYWRVRALDLAGNQSDNSITRTLIIE